MPSPGGLGLAQGRHLRLVSIGLRASAKFDRPDVQSLHPVHGDHAARLRFYARFGALARDLPYFRPPVSAETGREHGMLLAVFDQDGSIAERG